MAILLIGGDKTGNKRFYEEFVPVADRLYDEHLRAIKREGIFEEASEQEQVHGGSSSILRTPGQNVAPGTRTSGRKG